MDMGQTKKIQIILSRIERFSARNWLSSYTRVLQRPLSLKINLNIVSWRYCAVSWGVTVWISVKKLSSWLCSLIIVLTNFPLSEYLESIFRQLCPLLQLYILWRIWPVLGNDSVTHVPAVVNRRGSPLLANGWLTTSFRGSGKELWLWFVLSGHARHACYKLNCSDTA
jgi:hypothetical protein